MLALMLVPIPWLHEWKMKTVIHDARDHCVACHAAYGATAYANCANEAIVHQIQLQALKHPTIFLVHET